MSGGSSGGPPGAGQGLIYLEIEADAFLRRMVRALVGTMVEVGQGARTIDDFGRLLERRAPGGGGAYRPRPGAVPMGRPLRNGGELPGCPPTQSSLRRSRARGVTQPSHFSTCTRQELGAWPVEVGVMKRLEVSKLTHPALSGDSPGVPRGR